MNSINILKRTMAFATLLILTGCVGTEIVPELLDPVLELDRETAAVLVGTSIQLEFTLTDPSGILEDQIPSWISSDFAVADVSGEGLVTGIASGQAWITATAGTARDSVLVSVVEDSNQVATVEISGMESSVDVGSSIFLSAQVYDLQGAVLSEPVSWSSSDETLATVDASGQVNGISEGSVEIVAKAGGISSAPYLITVTPLGPDTRSGSFEGRGGYDVQGTVTVSEEGSGIRIALEDDFSSSSGGAGLYVYLSTVDSGPLTGSNSLNAGMLTNTDGSSSYTVDGIGINDFDYVVIYCEPFNLYFGIAELN